ncbi:hypothetical protein [uncultured Sulfitobacter sp.]|uniref:hypothetical protein n=1 Tax=uncultured Sulfitobacter sp. TaxID=191468 RepID=UPI002605AC42|nr:hypothetical protein [uncultured Sulfitobacter sp.]
MAGFDKDSASKRFSVDHNVDTGTMKFGFKIEEPLASVEDSFEYNIATGTSEVVAALPTSNELPDGFLQPTE